MAKRRVVVTGLGAVTPVGNDVATTWRALLDGKSGAGPISKFDPERFAVRFACEVKNFDPLQYMDRKEVKRSDLFTQYAVAAATQAMHDAGLDNGAQYDPDRLGVIIASGIGGLKTFEEQHDNFRERGPDKVSACASSAHAVGEAFRTIQYGDADLMIAGGAEATVSPMAISGFANMKALSERNDEPETASRPFDATRDGFVMGEGSAAVVLEELEHARKRGARIHAEIVGYGATADAYHLTAPSPNGEGAQRAMRRALQDASLTPEDVRYVNAHGTSTPANDLNETRAIKAVFDEAVQGLKVSSTKSCTGHMLGAAGAVEFVATTLAVRDGRIPPTINYRTPDPECDLDYTPNTAIERDVSAALSNSFGFGGHNVTLAVKRFDD